MWDPPALQLVHQLGEPFFIRVIGHDSELRADGGQEIWLHRRDAVMGNLDHVRFQVFRGKLGQETLLGTAGNIGAQKHRSVSEGHFGQQGLGIGVVHLGVAVQLQLRAAQRQRVPFPHLPVGNAQLFRQLDGASMQLLIRPGPPLGVGVQVLVGGEAVQHQVIQSVDMVVVAMGVQQILEMADAPLLHGRLHGIPKGLGAAVHHHAFAAALQQQRVALPHGEGRYPQNVLLLPVSGHFLFIHLRRRRKPKAAKQHAY